jgi:hypothetical protein
MPASGHQFTIPLDEFCRLPILLSSAVGCQPAGLVDRWRGGHQEGQERGGRLRDEMQLAQIRMDSAACAATPATKLTGRMRTMRRIVATTAISSLATIQ